MYRHLATTNIHNETPLLIKGDTNFFYAKLVDLFIESAEQLYDLVLFRHTVEELAYLGVYTVVSLTFVRCLIGLKLLYALLQLLYLKVCVVDLLDKSESFLIGERCRFLLLLNEFIGIFQLPSVFISHAQSVNVVLAVLELRHEDLLEGDLRLKLQILLHKSLHLIRFIFQLLTNTRVLILYFVTLPQ